MIRLAIADDHVLFREGIRSFFNNDEKYEIVAEVSNGNELLQLLNEKAVDVILMDITMPELDGIAATEKIKSNFPGIKIIMLTMHDTQNYIRKTLEIGADGYLLKTTSKQDLLTGIDSVLAGEKYYDQETQQIFMNSFNAEQISTSIHLTRREKEILELICEEYSTNEIADKLFVSKHTVETHRKNLLSKTGVKNVAGLVKFALKNKFI